MKRSVAALLIGLLLIVPSTAWADYSSIPGDANADQHLTRAELSTAMLNYLENIYIAETDTGPSKVDIQDAVHVYSMWDGVPRTVIDSTGNEIVLYRPVKRIAVLTGESLETLRAIGVETEKIVAIDKYSHEKQHFFPELTETENLGSVWSPDMERLVSVQPDTVFLYATISTGACDEIQHKLEGSLPGIRVFRFDCYKPETYQEEVVKIGSIVEKEDQAAGFSQFYSSIMEEITDTVASIPEEDRTQVYFEYWTDYKTVAQGAGYHEKIELAGGENIFADEPAEYPEIDPESVIVENPQVIVKLVGKQLEYGGYTGNDPLPFIEMQSNLISRPGWSSLDAVRDKRIYIIHSDLLGGVQHFIGTAYFATWFYPDLFADLDPATIHQQYLTEFQHLNFDSAADGIFVYP